MGTTQSTTLNDDTAAVPTSASFADAGAGTSRWFQWHRVDDGGDAGQGATSAAAVTDPTAAGSVIALLKGLLTFLRVSAAGVGKAEDAAHVDGDTGVAPPLAVRRDTAAASAGTDGDYSTLSVDALGRLRVNSAADPVTSKTSTSALAASLVAKASAGTLLRIIATNTSGSTQFVQVHNAASLPADTAVPFLVYELPGNTTVNLDLAPGVTCDTGIVVCNSSTAPTKTIGGADCWFDVLYE